MGDYVMCEVKINETDQQQAEVVFNESGVSGLVNFINAKQDDWKTIPLDIGVIGNSGVGKSTFINAMRNMNGDDVGAAAVGNNQCTMVPTPYAHPNNPLLNIWDLPGVGTPEFPRNAYFEQIQFERFDFFLVLSASRFTENDAWLAENIRKFKKPFFFVRTQMSVEVKKDKKGHPKTHNKAAVIEAIRKDVEKNLREVRQEIGSIEGQDDQYFLIDSYKTDEYDFNTLVDRLIKDYPELKRNALIMSLSFFTEEMIKKKVAFLRDSIWISAAVSGAVAAAPVPFLSPVADMGILVGNMLLYYKALGIDGESLKKLAEKFSVSQDRLNSVVESEMPELKVLLSGRITAEFMKSIGFSMAENEIKIVASNAVEEIVRFIPFVGSIIAAPLSFGTTYYALTKCLDKFEAVSLKVLRVCIDVSVANE